jgi:hypothetical protein
MTFTQLVFCFLFTVSKSNAVSFHLEKNYWMSENIKRCIGRNQKNVLILNVTVAENNRIIICFKIKNPPTVHSTSKIQPTTWPTFVFRVSASVRKKWGYARKLLDSRFARSSSCFLLSFYYFTQKV